MFTTPTQLAEIQKGQLDALYALSHTVFDATEKLIDLNLAAAKALMDESAEKAQAMLAVKDLQELVALVSNLAQPSIEKAISYSRNAYSIASNAGAEISKIFDAQVAEGNKRIAEMLDFAAKNAPAGAEPAVSMVRSAVAAANTAYDTFAKAAKQAVEVAESNFAAAAQATMKAAAAANDAVKAKAAKKVA
ncbi:MAG: phasin family protein [Sutterellaceae bacterium]|nr:phasin family protein [Burkholderiaceae bacterium]MDW8429311.1 phasin family protein [Sutterellaceae bacterium]